MNSTNTIIINNRICCEKCCKPIIHEEINIENRSYTCKKCKNEIHNLNLEKYLQNNV